MKKISSLLFVLFIISTLSSCSVFKKNKCDCPKFSEQPTQTQETEYVNTLETEAENLPNTTGE